MNRIILAIALGGLLAAPASYSKPKTIKEATDTELAGVQEKIEFQNADIALVLKLLACQAGVALVTEDVKGTVTLRLEDVTPLRAIDTIVKSKDLIREEVNGVIVLRSKVAPEAEKAGVDAIGTAMENAMLESIGPAITKVYDLILDHQSRPETARKNARAKKVLYDAFIAEGFTKEEAFRLVLADEGVQISNLEK